jgi:hypothetical protein
LVPFVFFYVHSWILLLTYFIFSFLEGFLELFD